ncbi:Cysteine--tRNA ligase, cytoplasmic [Oopsacas minuta]|uniref:Cysteine--tRNA ligase, cytoplasmic n=1 Tax=Oopsacas minuta TaxID=111878 RepID=A0AAV7JLA9_9METZ|nr:Cysteine--tRNA ligase, cytoplasmic [Oopsacas minuta]
MNILRFTQLTQTHLAVAYTSLQSPYTVQSLAFIRRMSENNSNLKTNSSPQKPVWQSPSEDLNLRDRLHLNNSITRRKDLFVPINSNLVTWYSCGPTVYDSSHMGHARTYLSLDILRRVLTEYFGYNILYVMNITDIDDKIIKRGRSRYLFQQYVSNLGISTKLEFRDDLQYSLLMLQEKHNTEKDKDKKSMLKKMLSALEQTILETQHLVKSADCSTADLERLARTAEYALSEHLDKKFGASITNQSIFQQLSSHYEEEFHRDMRDLGVLPPDVLTRVSEYVPEIVSFIQVLVDKNYAYESRGSVYFTTNHFNSTEIHQYAKLVPEAAMNLDQLQEGEGELTSSEEKRASQDFVLWKASKPGEPSWPSPWGQGRPGWHIECSAMATEIFGGQLDIHSGGVDLKFPHHDNEIAQTEAYYDSKQWINYFLHTGHLTIHGCKMAKSLKNFITIREALQKHTASQLRIFFLLHAWDSVLDYSSRALEEAEVYEAAVKNFFLSLKARLQQLGGCSGVKWSKTELELNSALSNTQTQIHRALCDSVNTGLAMKLLRELISLVNVYVSEADKAHHPIDSPLLLKTGTYLYRLYQILGVVASTQHSFMSTGADYNTEEDRVMPIALLTAKFRHEVRKQARVSKNTEILSLCDSLRDEQLVEVGIQLEDKPETSQNPYLVKLRKKEDIIAEREEKVKQQKDRAQEKEIQKQIMKDKQLRAEALRKIPPDEIFKSAEEIDKYSAFDENGIPTHDKDGEEIIGKARKILQKAFETQRKKYEKYLAEQSADT